MYSQRSRDLVHVLAHHTALVTGVHLSSDNVFQVWYVCTSVCVRVHEHACVYVCGGYVTHVFMLVAALQSMISFPLQM